MNELSAKFLIKFSERAAAVNKRGRTSRLYNVVVILSVVNSLSLSLSFVTLLSNNGDELCAQDSHKGVLQQIVRECRAIFIETLARDIESFLYLTFLYTLQGYCRYCTWSLSLSLSPRV